ncbi:putative signal transducing protein [Parachlamydia acanthamoebae]|uniref:putative signal transducing protein n=1 Tax=Parachlamydia acanthamoebae TaxID=83552 RepID=UPI0007517D19|nr:DUF2007 domain-containing protein [Parachlamydia acanthamoebae]
MNNFVCIYRTFDIVQANLIKSHFENEDILCVLKSNDASRILPHLGFSQGGIEILIHEQHLEDGLKILQEITIKL